MQLEPTHLWLWWLMILGNARWCEWTGDALKAWMFTGKTTKEKPREGMHWELKKKKDEESWKSQLYGVVLITAVSLVSFRESSTSLHRSCLGYITFTLCFLKNSLIFLLMSCPLPPQLVCALKIPNYALLLCFCTPEPLVSWLILPLVFISP